MSVAPILKKAFDPYMTAPLAAWEVFAALGEIVEVERDQIIKPYNATERYLYFILEGSGGVLLWNKNNFVCIDLCYEHEFFGDYMSFLTEQPSPLEVVLFEKTKLFRISKPNFNKVCVNTDFGNTICRFASEALFMHKQQQQIDILSKNATERYLDLLQRQPNVVQRTPQKHIASYLGITPQSLSRIRAGLVVG